MGTDSGVRATARISSGVRATARISKGLQHGAPGGRGLLSGWHVETVHVCCAHGARLLGVGGWERRAAISARQLGGTLPGEWTVRQDG